MDSDFLKWLLGGIGTAIVPLSGWLWKQRQAGLAQQKADALEITTLKVNLAVAETKLAAYGKSAPELTDQIDQLTERVAQLLFEADPSHEPTGSDRPQSWPYPRRRPIAPRRSSR